MDLLRGIFSYDMIHKYLMCTKTESSRLSLLYDIKTRLTEMSKTKRNCCHSVSKQQHSTSCDVQHTVSHARIYIFYSWMCHGPMKRQQTMSHHSQGVIIGVNTMYIFLTPQNT